MVWTGLLKPYRNLMPEFYFAWLLSVLYHIHGHVDTLDWESDQHPGWEMYQLELNSRTVGIFIHTLMSTDIHSLTKTHVTLNYNTWQCHFLGFSPPWHQMHPLPPSLKFKHIHSLGSVHHLSFATCCVYLIFHKKHNHTLSGLYFFAHFQIWSFVTSAIQSCVSSHQPSASTMQAQTVGQVIYLKTGLREP